MNTETNDQHHRELGHLGSAFKASTTTSCASDLDLDPAQSFWSAAANTDVTTSTSDPASSAPRRRSTTADILAHMLGSATDTSAPSASDFLANHHHTASSSSLGLASPAQLALSVEDGTNSGHCHYHYKRFRPNSFPGTKSSISSLPDLELQSPFALFGEPPNTTTASPPEERATTVRGLFGTPERRPHRPAQQQQRQSVDNDDFSCPPLPRAPDSLPRFPTPDHWARALSPSSTWSPSHNMLAYRTTTTSSSALSSPTKQTGRHHTASASSSSSLSSLRHTVLAPAAETPHAPPPLARVPDSMPRFPTPDHHNRDSATPRQLLFRYSSSSGSDNDDEDNASPIPPSLFSASKLPRPTASSNVFLDQEEDPSTQAVTTQPVQPLRLRPRPASLDSLRVANSSSAAAAEEPNKPALVDLAAQGLKMSGVTHSPLPPVVDDHNNHAPKPWHSDDASALPSSPASAHSSLSQQSHGLPTPDSHADLLLHQPSDYGFPRPSFHLPLPPAAIAADAGCGQPSTSPGATSPSGLSQSAFSDDDSATARGRDRQRKSVFGLFARSGSTGRSRSKSQAGAPVRSAKSSRAASPVDAPEATDEDAHHHQRQRSASRRGSFSNRLSGLLSRKKKSSYGPGGGGAGTDDEDTVPPTPALPAEFMAAGAPQGHTGSTGFFDAPAGAQTAAPAAPAPWSPAVDAKGWPKKRLRSRASSIFNKCLAKANSSPNLNAAFASSEAPSGLGICFKSATNAAEEVPPLPLPAHSHALVTATAAVSSLQIASAPLTRGFLSAPQSPDKALPSLPALDLPAIDMAFLNDEKPEFEQSAWSAETAPLSASTASQPSERSALFDSTRYNTTATSLEPSPRPQEDSFDQADDCEVLQQDEDDDDEHHSADEGVRVWPPPSTAGDSSYNQSLEASQLLDFSHDSMDTGEAEGEARDADQGSSSRSGPPTTTRNNAHPADRVSGSVPTSHTGFGAPRDGGHGSDSDSDTSSDGFGLPEASESEEESTSDDDDDSAGASSDSSEDDMPLAQRHPGALQAQKSLRERSRNSRKKLKGKQAKPDTKVAAKNPFQFQSTLMSTKPLPKHAPHLGERATKRASTPQPVLEGHSLLPHSDESVRKRTQHRTQKVEPGRSAREAALPPFVEQSVLAFTEAESAPGIPSHAPSAAAEAQASHASVARALTTARPSRPTARPPARSNTLPPPITTSSATPSTSTAAHPVDKITVYLRTLDGSCTVKNPTTAEAVVRDVPLPDSLSTIALWEVWTALGIERPLRPFETIGSVMESWDATSKAVFLAKRSWTNPPSVDQPIPVHAVVKPGKWSKRYLLVGNSNPTVRLYKSSKGQGDYTTLCSLAAFDSYLANAAHFTTHKPPKPSLLVLKSVQPFAFFERKEDAMHILSFGTAEQRDGAFALLCERRSKHLREAEAEMQSAPSPPPRSAEPGAALLSFDVNPVMQEADLPPKRSDAAFTATGLIARSKSVSKPQAPERLGRARSNSRPSEPGRARSGSRPPLPNDLGRSMSVKAKGAAPVPDLPPMPAAAELGFTGGGLLSRGGSGGAAAESDGQPLARSMTSRRPNQTSQSDLHRSKTTAGPRR